MAEAHAGIVNVMKEGRLFPPPREFAAKARIGSLEQYETLWKEAAGDLEGFWGKMGREIHWFRPYSKVLQWNEPFAKWFVDGETNVSYNCLDVHLKTHRRNKAAIIWEGEPGDVRVYTYEMLHREVCKFANVLKTLGIKKGDVVTMYMPMVPELAIAMLACARIGAVHCVIFGGFAAEAIADRNNDAKAKLIITADASWRRGKQIPLKANVDAAVAKSPTIEKCIVYRRTGADVPMQPDFDYWWDELMADASTDCPPEPMDSEAPLFILYTSGSTGKPKGVKHTTGGYNLYAKKTTEWVFDVRDEDVYWCTADIGWITGHTYVVYGPLSAGATSLIYEGAPDTPHQGRWWELIEKYRVNILYTAPTAIRTFIKWGDEWVDKYDISSLRLLGTVGEGINPEAWMWYHRKIGGGRCPIVDTWWQTETGGIMMTPLPGATPTKPGSCTKPLPGIMPEIVGEDRKPVPVGAGGWLTITQPWPGMLRGIWGDDERYKMQYWSDVPHKYLCGDNARCDEDGYYWIMGRIDDVLNVSGHRLSTIEVESALVSHEAVAEAAAVGRPHEIKGEAVAVFVTLATGFEASEDLRKALKDHVRQEIGALAVPDEIHFTAALPKTRSGKIMRRLLRDIAAGRETVGDTSTLEDYSVLARLRTAEE
ncbi:MAG: acetate--CoA ligase [Planctomycetaceae bacterium]|nr:acetate--CoA ligase [Planctomycetaceae bacterium]